MASDIQSQRHDRNALVLYGSETGNSQDAAEELGRMAERLHFVTRVCEMDRMEINLLAKYTVVIFAVSTTGQGEFPLNARRFWKSLLRKRLPPDCLGHVHFTTFGLGDSSYPQYNFAARKLHKRLEQLGAKEFYSRGEADEQHEQGIDGSFLPWSVDMRKHLLSLYPLPNGVTPIPPEVLLPPKFTLELAEDVREHTPQHLATMGHSKSKLKPKSDSGDSGDSDEMHNPLPQQQSELPAPQIPFFFDGPPAVAPSIEPETRTYVSPYAPPPPLPDRPERLDTVQNTVTMATKTFDFPSPFKDLEPRAVCDRLNEHFEGEPLNPPSAFPPPKFITQYPRSIPALLVENKRVTPKTHWQDVRQLTFLIPERDNGYDAGDTLNILPKNFPEDVQALVDLMGWQDVADRRVTFNPEPPDFFLADNLISNAPGLVPPYNPTLRDLLIHNLDITAIPKRHFFDLIWHSCDDPVHKDKLRDFADPSYTDEFYDYTSRPRRGILEILQDFPSVKLPWKQACQYFPLIKPRKYSIASGGNQKNCHRANNIRVQILVAIVKYKTVLSKVRQGLCSRYLAAMPIDILVHVSISEGSLGYETFRRSNPVILIGPGTGIAPIRSIVWDRAQELLQPQPLAETVIFYGGRNKAADYFYGNEWTFPHLKVTKVFTAFSRDQEQKIYVQDIIRREKMVVWALINKGAVIVVCGSSGNMPKAVREAILYTMVEGGGLEKFPKGRDDAETELKRMEKKKTYVQETW
ncbi:NADPH-dependent diflavin oxidoreductase [Lachnellula suecica]|uniref:NADPH-dependent diflavin oxidoreductase 1 n=1 Tax=Lachnellula suecica TaxID=602035 RepID=A0A8T9BY05_9HELO|nr:NADPH-dependent diflavin oxidoreductase [Lachnellula suecica]